MAKDAKGKMDYAAGKDLKSSNVPTAGDQDALREVGRGDGPLIHVKTNDLVYLQKLGVAATDQDIEFEYNGLTGHAKGAEYNADTGVLALRSAVKVSGLQNGQPLLLTAAKADLDRASHKAVLTQAKYVTVSGAGEARQTVEARHAVVTMRADSGVERMDGDGNVTVTAGDGMQMVGDRGEVVFGEENRPQSAHMMGHVTYSADDATRHAKGGSSEAKASFDSAGRVDKVVMSGGVHLNEQVQVTSGPVKDAWSERELNAATVEIGLAAEAGGRTRPRNVRASGDARLKVVDPAKDGKGSRSSSMGAEVLTAKFIPSSEGSRLDEVKGDGRTTLERVSETGTVETSSGDALEVRFRSTSTKASAPESSDAGFEGADIASALQQGHVVATRKEPRTKGDGDVSQTDHATAERASFDGGTEVLTLSGDVQLTNTDGSLSAERVAVEQKTGDATAEGSIKASYRQGTASAVVHVLAQRAEMKKSSGTAVFHGSAGKLARLWQGGSQVEAPVLEFNQKQRRLVAKGEGAGAPMAVRTVLVSTGSASTRAPDAGKAGGLANGSAAMRRPAVVRVASREMVYSDEARQADFTDGVRVESADGVMRGDRAVAYLQTSSADKAVTKKADAGVGFLGGSVERVMVSRAIEIDQPGRRATGDKLVYTASDGLFVLTGTPAAPPRVVDQARGVVTGAELQFHAEDESVVISNGDKGGTGLRVHTETRVKRDR